MNELINILVALTDERYNELLEMAEQPDTSEAIARFLRSEADPVNVSAQWAAYEGRKIRSFYCVPADYEEVALALRDWPADSGHEVIGSYGWDGVPIAVAFDDEDRPIGDIILPESTNLIHHQPDEPPPEGTTNTPPKTVRDRNLRLGQAPRIFEAYASELHDYLVDEGWDGRQYSHNLEIDDDDRVLEFSIISIMQRGIPQWLPGPLINDINDWLQSKR